jgi:hypothetical protein
MTKYKEPKFTYEDGDKEDCFKIHKKVKYVLTNGKTIIIPKGLETDFATIPRFFWVLFPPHLKKYRQAAVAATITKQTSSNSRSNKNSWSKSSNTKNIN